MAEKIPLGLYLWRRIAELGVSSVFGVPGDMNLELLDYINNVQGLSWVGTANELGAAYAADGYCRVKQSPGVIVTTMGVGELSAINGVAGAYTEQVKLIHIVGTTGTAVQKRNAMIHHCLGPNPDHRVYEKISAHVRATHCWLDDINTAPSEIDRVLRTCLETSLPVYIFVPMDFVHPLVIPPAPSQPLDVPPAAAAAPLIETVLSELYSARSPVILVDALVSRHRATREARQLLDKFRFPTFSTPMGKSIANESAPYFHSTYNGKVSFPGVAAFVEDASDLVLDLGPILSDSNTGGHTRTIAAEKLISVHPHELVVRGKSFPGTSIRAVLAGLAAAVDTSKLPEVPRPDVLSPPELEVDVAEEAITQSWIWRRVGEFVRPGDVLIGEAGTAQFGLSDAEFPENLTYLTQVYYGSIGYALPACLGRRSLALTAQEVGTMVKLGLENVLILVINNAGYTIERAIHGPEEAYNDIAAWNWQLMLSFFGDKQGKERSREVRTKDELEAVLALPEYTSPKSIQVVEVHMGRMDIPWRLGTQIDIVRARAAAAAENN
ncbi:thiamine diphosphate-binding protein [Macrophomina phaseolina]|uniref:Thiamine diphosphate-binding protein n=1 Tax=Macrophomina phaseolina TaxID=35725 RepID=A0ABQ8GDR5_9PEZI|nr:thiamine diphosphate-binding protein [Macrophomina phaseolina]